MAWWKILQRALRHRWLEARGASHAVPPAMVERLMQRVAASEQQHTGEVRICVEAALPASYLWKRLRARDRAITLFGKLRVWDTEHNNGVLIYLLLADRAIEIVADRALNRHVSPQAWQDLARRMGQAFREGRFEEGLDLALQEVTGLLVQHCPRVANEARNNELPDRPLVH